MTMIAPLSVRPSEPQHPHRLPRRVFVGAVVTPQTLLSIRVIKNAVIGIGTSGIIRFIEDLDEGRQSAAKARPSDSAHEDDRSSTPVPVPSNESRAPPSGVRTEESPASERNGLLSEQHEADEQLLQDVLSKHGWHLHQCEVIRLNKYNFICPGFIDTHTHAPQVPNLGLGQQYELLDWLQYVTFPRERKFEDPRYARKTYESVIQRMINSGTTCAAIYATLHEEATMILAEICNEKGIRALVGKCQMDRNSPVDYIEKNVGASMEATKNFIKFCRDLQPYGTQSPGDVRSSSLSSTSGSPEMDDSIARLSATMNEITSSVEGSSQAKKTEVKGSNVNQAEVTSSVTSSSKESTTSTATSKTSVSSQSTIASHARYAHRHNSSISENSSSSMGRGKSANGTDSPRRQKEREYANALVQPILTPRFAISCSDALLANISALMSREPSLRLQTHLSENEGEIDFTKKLFPFASTYTDVYDHFSLLTHQTILAHAVHLDDTEMELISKRKCGISHCPTSNNNLRSGASRIGEMLNRGIKVGLGTDMSGGFGLSILTTIRDASVVAKVLGFSNYNNKTEEASNGEGGEEEEPLTATLSKGASVPVDKDGHDDEKHRTPAVGNNQARHIEIMGSDLNRERTQVDQYDFCKGPLSIATLFYLATLGGAEVCNLAHRVGSLEVGKEFDALLIDTANGSPNLYIEEEDGIEEMLEKMLFCGDDRNITSVFVRGRVIGGSAPLQS